MEKGLFDYFKEAFTKNYANFDGRARRKEYWGFYLFYVLTALISALVGGLIHPYASLGIIVILTLASIIPSIAVTIRRLHDINKPGTWLLLGLIPFIGGIALFVFSLTEGDRAPNRFGPDPKATGGSQLSEHLV